MAAHTDFIYLDYNATTPVDPRVAEAMRPALTALFGNPSSGHRAGREARSAVEHARSQVAACLGCLPGEVVFTSGGSESDNWAIRGVVEASGGGHVITSAVEHPAILETVRALEQEGRIRLTVVPVDRCGRVDPEVVARALSADTVLVSVMLANNEVGTLEPITAIAELCRARGVLVHSDAAQAVGKVPVDVAALGIDLLTVAGHKLYAPKGVGALFVRRGVELAPLIRGAGHERGLRAGTENVASLVGLGAACELVRRELVEEIPRLRTLRDRFEGRVAESLPDVIRHGHPAERLPNTSSMAFPGVDANLLLTRLADEVAASAGAACHTEAVTPSHVLTAMGVDLETARSTVRFSVGRFTSEREIDEAAGRVVAVARELSRSGSRTGPAAVAGDVHLTRFTHGLGCACKMQPQLLERVLGHLPHPDRAEVLVGAETSDDACAWRLPDGTVLVQTLDFFTPIVDDPRLFGAIAAANALSDIYAMGATPLFALNIVAFPVGVLPVAVLEAILAGAQEVASEAGIPVLGGHTIEDTEPKFGWAVTGTTSADGLWRNAGAKPGDALVLTKPLGTGIWATAAKRGIAPSEGWQRACQVMRRLNGAAAELVRASSPHAVTDVTGFGLLGHLHELLAASGMDGEVWAEAVPVLDGTERLVEQGEVPGGTRANGEHAATFTSYGSEIHEAIRLVLADAQTSGGLLAALPAMQGKLFLQRWRGDRRDAAVIGRVTGPGTGRIRVTWHASED
ncbi:MAG: selenide, water dikinase SelD [Acidobacteriota bacterium]